MSTYPIHLALPQHAPQQRLRALPTLRRGRVQPQPLPRQADGAPLVGVHGALDVADEAGLELAERSVGLCHREVET